MAEFETAASDGVNVEIIHQPTETLTLRPDAPANNIVVHVPGQTGPKGADGKDGATGPMGPAGPANLVVSKDNPGLTEPGLWVQTFDDGSFSLWVEDGV